MVRTPIFFRITLFCLAAGVLLPWGAATAQEPLVPARFTPVNDSRGFRWDLSPASVIADGTNDCFDSGAQLRVNQTNLGFARPMMTPDGKEFVFTGKTSRLGVTRRVRLDSEKGAMRYLEIIQNLGQTDQQVSAVVRTDLGDSAAQLMTEADKPFAGQLGKDEGVLIAMQTGQRPGVIFVVCDPRAKEKPQIQVENNRSISVTYKFTLKPGASAAIVHYLAQRHQASPTEARELLKPLYRAGRLLDSTISKEHAPLLANFSVTSSGAAAGEAAGPALHALDSLLDPTGLTRGKDDLLVIDDGAKLTGAVTGEDLEIQTAFGTARVPFAELAGVFGGAGVQRPVRVFLRTGEVLSGMVHGGTFKMSTDTGLNLDIETAQIHLLALRTKPEDGAAASSAALLTTHQGDVLALIAQAGTDLQAATPWDMIHVPLPEIASLVYTRVPFPSYRLTLKDQSRLLVMLRGGEWRIPTARFGEVKLVPQSIRELRGAGVTGLLEEADEPPISGPHCMMIGGSGIAGTIDLPQLHLTSGTISTPLDPAKIVQIERSEEAGTAGVKITLADGQELSGQLAETVLPIRSGSRVWRVPAAHLVSVKTAAAEPLEQEKEKSDPAPNVEDALEAPPPTTPATRPAAPPQP